MCGVSRSVLQFPWGPVDISLSLQPTPFFFMPWGYQPMFLNRRTARGRGGRTCCTGARGRRTSRYSMLSLDATKTRSRLKPSLSVSAFLLHTLLRSCFEVLRKARVVFADLLREGVSRGIAAIRLGGSWTERCCTTISAFVSMRPCPSRCAASRLCTPHIQPYPFHVVVLYFPCVFPLPCRPAIRRKRSQQAAKSKVEGTIGG